MEAPGTFWNLNFLVKTQKCVISKIPKISENFMDFTLYRAQGVKILISVQSKL
jgi:hypothetical protein